MLWFDTIGKHGMARDFVVTVNFQMHIQFQLSLWSIILLSKCFLYGLLPDTAMSFFCCRPSVLFTHGVCETTNQV